LDEAQVAIAAEERRTGTRNAAAGVTRKQITGIYKKRLAAQGKSLTLNVSITPLVSKSKSARPSAVFPMTSHSGGVGEERMHGDQSRKGRKK